MALACKGEGWCTEKPSTLQQPYEHGDPFYDDIISYFGDGRPIINGIQKIHSCVVTSLTEEGLVGEDEVPKGFAPLGYLKQQKTKMKSMLSFLLSFEMSTFTEPCRMSSIKYHYHQRCKLSMAFLISKRNKQTRTQAKFCNCDVDPFFKSANWLITHDNC